MKYLLHCVFRGGDPPPKSTGPPWGGELSIVESSGLAAALARWEKLPPAAGQASIPQLATFERVIARIHQSRTVIPFRFGCVLDSREAVCLLLSAEAARLERLLARLDGLTEVSLRVWHTGGIPVPALANTGSAYLAALRIRYGATSPSEEAWAAEVRRTLAGLYAECRMEARPAGHGRLLFLHFLVPRPGVDDFRAQARTVPALEAARVLVSGPWPPYNFVGQEP